LRSDAVPRERVLLDAKPLAAGTALMTVLPDRKIPRTAVKIPGRRA
jgi:hypothetical protein